MIDRDAALTLLTPGAVPSPVALESIESLGFADAPLAVQRFQSLCESDDQRQLFLETVVPLLHALAEAAEPDGSLLNFQRFVQTVDDRAELFQSLGRQPRAVEILVKLFVGSQYLSEILLRNPHYLAWLTEHKRLAEFKSRLDFIEQGRAALALAATPGDAMNHLRRVQQREMLRLAACDTFGLMDLKTVTLQLALLADGIVQVALECAAAQEGIDVSGFAVLAFGKLGGEELNYSSDIDLVFVCEREAERYWGAGQKLIRFLSDATDLGFLYRVDMRLRPWGDAGALVTTVDAYVDYLRAHGRLWEKQALLKARPVAGNLAVGQALLQRVRPIIFDVDPAEARQSIRALKQRMEDRLLRRGHRWGEVKTGPGGIRDVEFVTQYLQLVHGGDTPGVRSINTLDGLVRLADCGLLEPEEYRRLTGGYIVLRTIEHALQLMHNKQEHQLPETPRGLAYLARRLDFPDAQTFVQQYERHTQAIREVFVRRLDPSAETVADDSDPLDVDIHFGQAATSYRESFSAADARQHVQLLQDLGPQQLVRVLAEPAKEGQETVTFVGVDRLGDLSAICGLLFAHGFDIQSGNVFTGADVELPQGSDPSGFVFARGLPHKRQRKFVNVFTVRRTTTSEPERDDGSWDRFEEELNELLLLSTARGIRETQGRLARRVAAAVATSSPTLPSLLPLNIEIDNASAPDASVLHIRGEDTPGFLYELTNAIAVSGLSINRMTVQSRGSQVLDTLYVVDERNRKLISEDRLRQLRAAIVLTKHFTHLLPQSPNPESALIHFQEFLENLFRQPDWLDQLSPLHDSEVLAALATLLGISDFLWDDFLRLQHENLFPVVTNVAGLERARDRQTLRRSLRSELAEHPPQEQRRVLNAFKDREMMRVDMRHILGLQDKFGMFSRELTGVAETVVQGALQICLDEALAVHGAPQRMEGGPARLSVCALGKFGGRELGYASDIELMFLYDADGHTLGPQSITNQEFYQRLVDQFVRAIHSKRKGIFEIDLRLRPYGKAGSLAVSRDSFASYFGQQGAAWPFERQALVKLRPVAGDTAFGREIVKLRDRLIYRGEPFDVAAMRAMREKQIRQLVQGGTFNAKLSPGGLVDCEYLVQGLQITFGHLHRSIREPNTREAMKALEAHGILAGNTRLQLRDAYRFLRRLIDALRMVRGDASDLTVPPAGSDEFVFLARRLGYGPQVDRLRRDLERHTRHVIELSASLELLMARNPIPHPES